MKISSPMPKRIILWATLILAIACSFFSFWYTDIGDTLDNGVMLAESIVNGEFLDYYEYAALNSSPYTGYSANYCVLLYAIFALWNLPTVILHLNNGFDYMTSTPALLWCKLIIVAAIVGIFLAVRKLTEKLGGSADDRRIAGYLAVSSLCVTVPALIASQYDCLSLLFMILGIIFYAEGKNKLFLLMFAIAVPLKLFAVFIFIPMILIRFKNVLKILGATVAVMLPSYIIDLPFKGNMYYKAAMDSQNSDALDLLLKSNISLGEVKINLFFVAYIVICFLCYMKRADDRTEEARYAVYYSFAVFAAFCTLIPIRSYWIILFTPFLAVLAATKKGGRVVPIIADTLAGLGGGLYFLAHHWIYNTGNIASILTMNGAVLAEETDQKYGSFSALLDSIGFADMKYVFFAVMAASFVFALRYFYPESEQTFTYVKDGTSTDDRGTFWILLSRPVILLIVFLMLIYCQYAAIPAVKYGLASYEDTMDTDLMTGETVSDVIAFDADESLTTMTLHLDTWAYRSARAFVGVRMCDAETNEVLFEDSVGIVLIENDRADFELDGLAVSADKEYKIELYAIMPELAKGGTVYPYKDSSGNLGITFR